MDYLQQETWNETVKVKKGLETVLFALNNITEEHMENLDQTTGELVHKMVSGLGEGLKMYQVMLAMVLLTSEIISPEEASDVLGDS